MLQEYTHQIRHYRDTNEPAASELTCIFESIMIEFQMAIKMYDPVAFKHELIVLYNRPDFASAASALTLLQCFYENNLISSFVETVKLLKNLYTMPMTPTESERCFSTLKRIKSFSINTMKESRLCALAMCLIETELFTTITNFNKLVTDLFAQRKERRMDFVYKKINEK